VNGQSELSAWASGLSGHQARCQVRGSAYGLLGQRSRTPEVAGRGRCVLERLEGRGSALPEGSLSGGRRPGLREGGKTQQASRYREIIQKYPKTTSVTEAQSGCGAHRREDVAERDTGGWSGLPLPSALCFLREWHTRRHAPAPRRDGAQGVQLRQLK